MPGSYLYSEVAAIGQGQCPSPIPLLSLPCAHSYLHVLPFFLAFNYTESVTRDWKFVSVAIEGPFIGKYNQTESVLGLSSCFFFLQTLPITMPPAMIPAQILCLSVASPQARPKA